MTAVHDPRIHTLTLGREGRELARCQVCRAPTGGFAYVSGDLRGLYCTEGCATRALLMPRLRSTYTGGH